MECDHIFKTDTVDILPAPYCDESSDKEMDAPSKGSNGKMPDLPVPATPPKSPSNMGHVTSVQVPKLPSQLITMSELQSTSSVQGVGVQDGLKFQFLPLDNDQHMWLWNHAWVKCGYIWEYYGIFVYYFSLPNHLW